jgi:pyridoxine 5-phosphate synthase
MAEATGSGTHAAVELSVNVNKIALMRNSRGGGEPDVLAMARLAMDHGAYGITVHPRPDLRHVRPDDVRALARMLRTEYPGAEFNIEGNPFAPANDRGYPGLLALVRETRPDQCTLVPDGDAQLTSDHGFDLAQDGERLQPLIAGLHAAGARVSLFMDAESAAAMPIAARIGADRIELYTGPYAHAVQSGSAAAEAALPFRAAALAATAAGLGVNAGHDLNLENLGAFARMPGLLEVSIGHALVGDALRMGMGPAVARYVAVLRNAARTSTRQP